MIGVCDMRYCLYLLAFVSTSAYATKYDPIRVAQAKTDITAAIRAAQDARTEYSKAKRVALVDRHFLDGIRSK